MSDIFIVSSETRLREALREARNHLTTIRAYWLNEATFDLLEKIDAALSAPQEPSFAIGQPVVKTSGKYHPPGTYRGAVTTEAGDVRVVVEHDYGMLHIYSPEQIAPLPSPPAQGGER